MFKAAMWAVAAATLASAVPLTQPHAGAEIIPGHYIAQVRANITDEAHAALASKLGMTKHKIGTTFRALSGALNDAALQQLLNEQDVTMVEYDAVMRTMQTCPNQQTSPVPSWGQVRVTSNAPTRSTTFHFNQNWGAGVDVYVLDTGIRCSSVDFTNNRCIWGANYAGGANTDNNGHGTHCAGTIVGNRYGFARSATVIAVKVLSDDGQGTVAGIVGGCEWATSSASARGRPSVMSFSLGGIFNQAMDNAVDAMVRAGGHVVVASGNNNLGACNFSPARAPLPITVSATAYPNAPAPAVDIKASYSNWGQCVDIWAPGSNIVSTGIASDNATNTFSGTSMACPHVAGALTIYLTSHPRATPAVAKEHILSTGARNIIQDITDDRSPNLLLHVQC